MNFQCLDREIWIPSGFFVSNIRCCATVVARLAFVKCFGMEDVVLVTSGEGFLTSFPPSVVDPVPFFNSTGFLLD